MWSDTLENFFKRISLSSLKSCLCIFINLDGNVFILAYVSDSLIIGVDKEMVNELIRRVENEFSVKVMECLSKFLGLIIQRDVSNGCMVLHQGPYLEAVLEQFGIKGANSEKTPMEAAQMMEIEESDVDRSLPYRELIGCLNYIAQGTGPDIMFAVNFLS